MLSKYEKQIYFLLFKVKLLISVEFAKHFFQILLRDSNNSTKSSGFELNYFHMIQLNHDIFILKMGIANCREYEIQKLDLISSSPKRFFNSIYSWMLNMKP